MPQAKRGRSRRAPWQGLISDLAIGFLPLWLRRANLESVVTQALRGNRGAIDGFVPQAPGSARQHRAQPRGLLVHWVAGNVPLLGMISLSRVYSARTGTS